MKSGFLFIFLISVQAALALPPTGILYGENMLISNDSLGEYLSPAHLQIIQQISTLIEAKDSTIYAFNKTTNEPLYDYFVFRSLGEEDIQRYYKITSSACLDTARAQYIRFLGIDNDNARVFKSRKFIKNYDNYLSGIRQMLELSKLIMAKSGEIDYFEISDGRTLVKLSRASEYRDSIGQSGIYDFDLLITREPLGTLLYYENLEQCRQRCAGLVYYDDSFVYIYPYFHHNKYICDFRIGFAHRAP
jgi:hypothetical protein